MLGGAESPGGVELLTVTVARDDQGYGMKVSAIRTLEKSSSSPNTVCGCVSNVIRWTLPPRFNFNINISGDNPVYVQSVKEHGAAWRAGLRAGDRILRVDNQLVAQHSHQHVVQMIRANPTTVLTVQQTTSRLKTPITAPVPANLEKQRQFEASKVKTMRLMLEKEQKYIRDLRNELLKVPDVRKSAELESAEQRCFTLQREIDGMMGTQQLVRPTTPKTARTKPEKPSSNPPTPNIGFLSGLPRSLSNLTGQSLRNLRQARQKSQNEIQTPLVRQNSDETNNKRRHIHNNTVPLVPTTCLDNSPPPLPPRTIRNPCNLSSPTSPTSPPVSKYYKPLPETPRMAQSMPAFDHYRRSSHSLDGEVDGPLPNSIALQMSYPLVNVPPPPLQIDNRTSVPVLHMRSRSSPDQLEHDLSKSFVNIPSPLAMHCSGPEWGARDTPPPGTPPPPYHTNTQPCADPQRAIISMEEDDSPASDNSTYSGLFSNLRSVRESKARTAVLLNWLLGERRCACACLLLVLTDSYRGAAVPCATLRRWAYEIHSTFLMPHAVLQLSGVDENMANEIDHVLVNEFEKEELLRNVFRKARQKAKEELAAQLSEFQVKRQVGLASLYGPDDSVIDKCDVDKIQEQAVVERLMCGRLRQLASAGGAGGVGGCAGGAGGTHDAHHTLMSATAAAALALHCRPAAVAAAVGSQRPTFLQRDKPYKQRVKQITKQHPQPFIVRGHHLQSQALTSVGHCHHCGDVIAGLAPQSYFCIDCKLCVHRACAKHVEESCCIDGEHHNNRISRFIERIQSNQLNSQDAADKKSRKASGTANFLNMERSFRKAEDEPSCEPHPPPPTIERRDESDESLYESADCHSDAISASDDALPRFSKTPTMSKESLKLAVTDEESDPKFKKGHRKAMSLSNTLEIVKNLGDEWLVAHKKELEKNSDKKKSRESLWSEEDRDSINGSTTLLDQIRKNSRKEDKSQSNSRKSSTVDPPKRKISKGSSVSLNFLRRKKTPTSTKPVEVVPEDPTKVLTFEEILNFTRVFLECERSFASVENRPPPKPLVVTDTEDEEPTPTKQLELQRRRLSRQTSRSKSKARGKSQSLKINTLRKSHSGTLKKNKKKGSKTPSLGRSRQTSIVEQPPLVKKKHSQSMKHNSWLFSGYRGETRREGSTEEPTAPDADGDTSDAPTKDADKDNTWRAAPPSGRGVNRAESCRERDAPRRGKHRNASDPNRLTAHHNSDLEPGSATAPSGSSSSSSLSSRSNESNTVPAEHQASQSDISEDEDDALASQWADSIAPHILASIDLSARLRKRQEVIHELIVSEGSHVRWLKVLGRVFLRPLESQPSLLPVEELRALFPNLPAVRERHGRLYGQLRALRADTQRPLVDVRAVADAMLNTLGDSSYATTLARFCRGQRMALEGLRERRRKNKDLHQFLASREQLPTCGRLQLRDLLACVWQRLTKYQLLLESVLKTLDAEDSSEIERINKALGVAKEVLHSVDTAIRTAENEHRLRSIQSKLEVRAPNGAEWDELRRLDLTAHSLTVEGELAIRNDSNKKIHVLALMLEACLVLIQREGDKFLLKPIQQPSQQQHLSTSPLIKWDKVLFRPNAAVRNTFFLMNINGVQMHELSANSNAEYATWVKHIQEAPLAKLTELKQNITSHQASRSTDDSGINVSRNPSDASEKSNSTAEDDHERLFPESDIERDRMSEEREEKEKDEKKLKDERESEEKREKENVEREEKSVEREDSEEKHIVRRPTVGRISTHTAVAAEPLASSAALIVVEPDAHTAHTALSNRERLRRLDAGIARCLRAKSAVVGEMLGIPQQHFTTVADLAVAEARGLVDVSSELRARGSTVDGEDSPDIRQLLLAACTQANQLTLLVRGALTVNETAAVAARTRAGRCDTCRRSRETVAPVPPPQETDIDSDIRHPEAMSGSLDEYDTLAELDSTRDGDDDDEPERAVCAASLAARLVEVTCGLQDTLGALLAGGAPRGEGPRAELAALRDTNDALRARLRQYEMQTVEEISFPKADPTMQDQPSNGG